MGRMSVRGEISTDIYRQMMDLQEKLRQSEAERIQLKEMFAVLVKTFREEEDMRLKSLENRYHTFMEDCARRSYRNEKILRSVERVESGANALHAKTERLKLLRSHYEAYLERVISSWRQPSLLRHDQSPLSPMQEVEWSRRNRLIVQEKVEPTNSNYLPSGRLRRSYDSNAVITSENLANRLSDGEKRIRSFQGDRTHSDDSYWNRMSREPEGKEKLKYEYDKPYHEDFKHLEPISDRQSKVLRGRFEDEFFDDGMPAMKGFESALRRKLVLGSKQDSPRDLLYQDDTYKESVESLPSRVWDDPDLTLYKQAKARASPVCREEHWFTDRSEALPHDVAHFDKSYINATPKITREPVEIKKPEIIVGKVHPESSLKVDFNSPNFKDQPTENVKSDNLLKPISDATSGNKERKVELESVRSETEVRTPSPQEKGSLLKHRRRIDKLKENLSYEEAQEQNMTNGNKQRESILVQQKSVKQLRKDDETEVSKRLSDGWRPNGDELMSSRLVVQAGGKDMEGNGSEQLRTDEKTMSEFETEYQENFQEVAQKDDNIPNKEVYEDNEESYPESYYEQPPKSDYSRDIVSNVILEEDENEVNMHDESPEGQAQNNGNIQENNGYEQSQYQVGQEDNIQNNCNGYTADGTEELKENGSEYQNFQPNDSSYNGNMYQPNYSEIQSQEEYTYDNQNINNYDRSGVLEYNAMEQYPGNADPQQYYESQQSEEHGNYGGEGIGQEENFDNGYNQVQNYENNPDVEQYNDDNGPYQQEYSQVQNGNYYNEGEYEDYYQGQQEQNEKYSGSNEQENMGYAGATAYGNVEDGGTYAEGSNNLPLRQSTLSHLLESDSESFQMEHGSVAANEDSDFDFSMSQQQ